MFKEGDRVKRTGPSFGGVGTGGVYTVRLILSDLVGLVGHEGHWYSAKYFKKEAA